MLVSVLHSVLGLPNSSPIDFHRSLSAVFSGGLLGPF